MLLDVGDCDSDCLAYTLGLAPAHPSLDLCYRPLERERDRWSGCGSQECAVWAGDERPERDASRVAAGIGRDRRQLAKPRGGRPSCRCPVISGVDAA